MGLVNRPAGGRAPADRAFIFGDVNCDGAIVDSNVDPFALAMTSAGNPDPLDDYYVVYANCDPMLADVNADGEANLFDIDPFTELLTGD